MQKKKRKQAESETKKGLHAESSLYTDLKNFVTERVRNQLKKTHKLFPTLHKLRPPPKKKSKTTKNTNLFSKTVLQELQESYTPFCKKKHKVAPGITEVQHETQLA